MSLHAIIRLLDALPCWIRRLYDSVSCLHLFPNNVFIFFCWLKRSLHSCRSHHATSRRFVWGNTQMRSHTTTHRIRINCIMTLYQTSNRRCRHFGFRFQFVFNLFVSQSFLVTVCFHNATGRCQGRGSSVSESSSLIVVPPSQKMAMVADLHLTLRVDLDPVTLGVWFK